MQCDNNIINKNSYALHTRKMWECRLAPHVKYVCISVAGGRTRPRWGGCTALGKAEPFVFPLHRELCPGQWRGVSPLAVPDALPPVPGVLLALGVPARPSPMSRPRPSCAVAMCYNASRGITWQVIGMEQSARLGALLTCLTSRKKSGRGTKAKSQLTQNPLKSSPLK